jgi:hypothetical protein
MRDHLMAYAMGLKSVAELGQHKMNFKVVNTRPEISNLGTLNAADLRWKVQSSTDMIQWTDVVGSFTQVQDVGGVRLIGPPKGETEKKKYYRVSMSLDVGLPVETGIVTMTKASRYGITGNASWNADPASGDLVSSGSNAGEVNQLVVEVSGPKTIDFEMSITGAGAKDSFVFYVDGFMKSQTSGAPTRVHQTFANPGTHLLMWEFKRGTGNALIRNLAP